VEHKWSSQFTTHIHVLETVPTAREGVSWYKLPGPGVTEDSPGTHRVAYMVLVSLHIGDRYRSVVKVLRYSGGPR
jgi:hypothetical protein